MQVRAGSAALGVLTAGLLCSCSTMTLAPGAAAILLTNRAADVQNCKAAGYVRVPDDVPPRERTTVLRNQALALAADSVLLTGWHNGVAYSCSEHAAAPNSEPAISLPAAAQPTVQPVAAARPPGSGEPVVVSVAKAERGDIDLRIAALGTVTPLSTVTVKTQVSGQLQQVAFGEGQIVHEGDFLAQIDPGSYQTALDHAQGVLKRDQALLASARLELKRAAPQQAEMQMATVEQYMGSVDADQAAVAAAKLNLGATRIVAPITGRAGLRRVDPGNYVTPGDGSGIVVITQLQPISVLFTVPVDRALEIAKRLAAGATLPVIAFDTSHRTRLAAGKLLALDNQADTATATVKLRAAFDTKDDVFFPNQFVNVEVLMDTVHNQVVIPEEAVQRGPAGLVVYLVDTKSSTVSMRGVQLGVDGGERASITSGLAPGDLVVTSNAYQLHDGAKVQLRGGGR